MANITADDIFAVMKGDFLQKFGFAYKGGDKDELTISDVCGFGDGKFAPVKLRAMWLYYLDDAKEREFGYSVKRFTEPRVLMKLAVRVHKTPKGFTGKTESHEYICEGWLCWPMTCMMQINFYTFPESDVPEVAPEPCFYCQGPMVRVGSERHQEKYKAGMDAFKQTDDYKELSALWDKSGVQAVVKQATRPVPEPDAGFDLGDIEEDFF